MSALTCRIEDMKCEIGAGVLIRVDKGHCAEHAEAGEGKGAFGWPAVTMCAHTRCVIAHCGD